METIVLNYYQSNIDLLLESFAIRAAYLLSETFVSAGTSYYYICYDHYQSTETFLGKVRVVEDYHKNWAGDSAWNTRISEIIKLQKSYNKIKHHPAKGIIVRKQFEKAFDAVYQEVSKIMRAKYMQTGLPQLQPIWLTDQRQAYPLSRIDPEENKGDMLPVSKLLLLELSEDFTPPHLFILTPHFFEKEFFSNCKVIESFNDNATEAETAYLHSFFIVPNVNLLSATELQIIREQLSEAAKPFHLEINKWAALVKEPNGNSNSYLANEVYNVSRDIQKCLDNNELLKLCSRKRNDEVFFEVLVGEMPVTMIWEYYKHYKVINENTWQILMESKEKRPSLKGRWPVILFRNKNFKNKQEIVEAAKQEPVTAVKKSLIVD